MATSVVHFSEFCNIIDDYLPFQEAVILERALLYRENMLMVGVTQMDYLKAVSVAQDCHVGANDALAYILMKKEGVQTIYSFNKDFDVFKDIKRVTE